MARRNLPGPAGFAQDITANMDQSGPNKVKRGVGGKNKHDKILRPGLNRLTYHINPGL